MRFPRVFHKDHHYNGSSNPPTSDSQGLAQDANGSELGTADYPVAADKLARILSACQVQMIAIGGTIGTGLFLGTGKPLATGCPASMLITYAIVGFIVFITMFIFGGDCGFCTNCRLFLYIRWPVRR